MRHSYDILNMYVFVYNYYMDSKLVSIFFSIHIQFIYYSYISVVIYIHVYVVEFV